MSEEFDREAEKKRLREKFENEQETRQTTEHMSELLLQGATMTNRHCDDCGDPIFRYDGQEFCPTCQQPAEASSDSGDEQAAPTDQPTADDQHRDDQTAAPADNAGNDRQGQPADGARSDSTERDSRGVAGAASRQAVGSSERQPAATESDEAHGDLGAARASLVRTLASLASEAQNATDVRRTRDLLSAAREAAEAVAALDRADR